MTMQPTSRPLRVLTLVDGIGTYGGGERIARQLATQLDPDRFETTFCVSRWDNEPTAADQLALAELREGGTRFLGLNRRSRAQLGPWRELIAYLREWDADILHSHKIGSNLWASLLAPRANVPVLIAHEHTWSFKGNPQRKFIDRNLIARRADAFIAVSREDRRRMIEIERIPEPKTRYIPNGVPALPPPDPAHDVRAELGLEAGTPLVGVVAVLRAQKAIDVMLQAADLIREAVPDVHFVFVGGAQYSETPLDEDDYVQGLQRLVTQLDLERSVSFLGARLDVPDLLRAFDVTALSSDYEGSPLSILEYMAASKPVVATRVGGVPDLVEEGVSGLLVEPRDPRALADAVLELLGNRKRAAEMGRAGYERWQREFSIEAMVESVQDLYDQLYGAKMAGFESAE